MTTATLVLADGRVFKGRSFGYEGETAGEVVFNTSITGYQEILTDPSYAKQIVLLTYPMIGNYGTNPEDIESKKPQAAGLIVKEYCNTPSNWRSTLTLATYLRQHKVVGVDRFPTREIVRHIRDKGAMPGILAVGNVDQDALITKASQLASMEGQNLITEVTCRKWYRVLPKLEKPKYQITAFDFGIKQNIIRELSKRGCAVKVVPADTKAREVLSENPDGVLLSNGPGDPAACSDHVKNIKRLIGKVPLMGICLGHQLLSLALGAKSFKLKFGHRGSNQPVHDLETGKVLITSQNHGFAIDASSFPTDMKVTQINLNDKTVEAFKHKKHPIISIQYHPEASPGPHDAANIFDQFCEML